jgi:antitoxin FitA
MVVFWFHNGTILRYMKTITLKNIPEDLYSRLKLMAKENQRSLNGEILFALQTFLLTRKERPSAEEVIRQAREFREKIKVVLSDDEIENAINEGRE